MWRCICVLQASYSGTTGHCRYCGHIWYTCGRSHRRTVCEIGFYGAYPPLFLTDCRLTTHASCHCSHLRRRHKQLIVVFLQYVKSQTVLNRLNYTPCFAPKMSQSGKPSLAGDGLVGIEMLVRCKRPYLAGEILSTICSGTLVNNHIRAGQWTAPHLPDNCVSQLV